MTSMRCDLPYLADQPDVHFGRYQDQTKQVGSIQNAMRVSVLDERWVP